MKTYTEAKKIRPDILTKTMYFSFAIVMAYTIISHRIAGDRGGFFMAGPMTLYVLFYLGFVQAVQKAVYVMVRVRARRSQFMNAEANMQRSMRIFGISGALIGILVIVLSYYISKYLFGTERNIFQTALVGLCIMLFGVQGVIRGYLQGLGYTKPLLVSDMLIAVCSTAPGIIAVAVFNAYGEKVNALFHSDLFRALYGATGMTMGLTVGALVGFFYIITSFRLRKGEISDYVKSGAPKYLDNKNDVLTGIRPILAIYCTPALFILLDQVFYTLYTSKFDEGVDYIPKFGMLYGRIVVTTVFMTLILCAPFVNSWSRVMARVERDEYDYARKRMRNTIRNSNLLHIPVSIFIFAMAGTFQMALFGKSSIDADTLTMIAAPFIYFCCQALFFSWLLTHMGKSVVSIVGIVVSFLLHIISIVVLVIVLKMGIKGVLIAELISVTAYAVLCFWLVSKMLRYRQEWIMSYLFPLVSSIIGALAAFLLNRVLISVIGEILTFILCMIAFWIVYMLAMTISGGLMSSDLEKIPLGSLFMGIAAAFKH